MKICTKCGELKNDYEKGRNVCRECRKLQFSDHRNRKKEERNQYSRSYRQANPDRVLDNWNSYYERNKEKLKDRQKKKYRENPLRHILYAAKSRADKFGFPFDIQETDLMIPKVCPVLGIPLEVGGDTKYNSPSLDKIIPEKGYVKGNVAVMSFRANQIKGTATLEELKSLVKFMETFLDTPSTL